MDRVDYNNRGVRSSGTGDLALVRFGNNIGGFAASKISGKRPVNC